MRLEYLLLFYALFLALNAIAFETVIMEYSEDGYLYVAERTGAREECECPSSQEFDFSKY